jgi:hypothetical protein
MFKMPRTCSQRDEKDNAMNYDDYKLETPEDEYARKHPSKRRRGVYRVTVERTITATITVDVEASSEEDANWDGFVKAKSISLDNWTIDQDDLETIEVDGRDPDDARDERMDRDG